jgi:hypothetical protein
MEEFILAGVQGDHANRFIRDNQRQRCDREDSGIGVLLSEWNLKVAAQIVDDDRLFLPHCPRRHVISQQWILARGMYKAIFDVGQPVLAYACRGD